MTTQAHAETLTTETSVEWIAELTRQECDGIESSQLPVDEAAARDWDVPVNDEVAQRARKLSADLRRP